MEAVYRTLKIRGSSRLERDRITAGRGMRFLKKMKNFSTKVKV
jgi:hypothetical protein